MKPNVFLTGFMGTGKTTIGKTLAAIAEMEFYDLDTMIEEAAGISIPQIFEHKGECWFRKLESKILTEAACGSNKVLATGGGVVLNPDNRNQMRSSGIVVALTASLETLWSRLKNQSNRPLLRGEDPKKIIETLYNQRCALYNDAHFIVDVNKKSPLLIAEEILQLINTIS